MDNRWDIVRYIRPMNEGQCNPFIALCSNGVEESEFIIKAKGIGRPKADPVSDHRLYNEYFGNRIARAIGIHTPEPMVIHVHKRMAGLVNRQYKGGKIAEGYAVGSRFRAGIIPWSKATFLKSDSAEAALRILACDVLLHNIDRKDINPNCGFIQKDIIAFDYEMCFYGFYNPGICSKEIGLTIRRDHIFANSWRSLPQRLFDEVQQNIRSINAPFLKELNRAVPEQWECEPDKLSVWLLQRVDDATSTKGGLWELLR